MRALICWLLFDARLPWLVARALDPIAPWLLGLAIGRRPRRVR